MPHRLVSLAILVGWAIAATALLTRDVLPDLLLGPPPDLRSVSLVDPNPRPTKWAILVADDAKGGELRSVGQASTRSVRKQDGFVTMTNLAWVDSGELLRGTRLETMQGERVEIGVEIEIDPTGSLDHFRAWLRPHGSRDDLLTLTGAVQGNALVVKAQGPLALMRLTRRFAYQPRGMVQGALGPLERMPGLRVGQRWESRVVSPLTGEVQVGRVAVLRKHRITWDSNPVTTLEVVTQLDGPLPFSARTWVRQSDGLVLRQEVPTPMVKLLLERVPDESSGRTGGGSGR